MESLTVVKIGGKVINEEAELDIFLKKFAALKGNKILVHGGGNIASVVQNKMGIPPKMVEGRRITDADAIDIVTMVFSGLNKKIVAKLQSAGIQSLGVSGADGNLIRSRKRSVTTIDYGYVGDVEEVNASFLKSLFDLGMVPVVCALTHDNQGQLLNTNADTIASELARGIADHYQVDLVYCFEQPGVLSDFENKVVIPEITPEGYVKYKEEGVVVDGMIPKLDNAFDAINAGVDTVKICHFEALDKVQSVDYPGTTLCLK
ncbi:acetylglutamate kinase [Reichenbachiella sp. 5M10]|uniref:acetylglutamate kinase n=1 Tax=Reichenbachiella sp. 5M10 TaxID=1889772 RepID=UPI000C153445|nr:acetylglutamate kinase [Reichenbachiella sp. 5M10]PIB35378.1 acetylglutamate kinase [Reichenbachiella sp. 5M10]